MHALPCTSAHTFCAGNLRDRLNPMTSSSSQLNAVFGLFFPMLSSHYLYYILRIFYNILFKHEIFADKAILQDVCKIYKMIFYGWFWLTVLTSVRRDWGAIRLSNDTHPSQTNIEYKTEWRKKRRIGKRQGSVGRDALSHLLFNECDSLNVPTWGAENSALIKPMLSSAASALPSRNLSSSRMRR